MSALKTILATTTSFVSTLGLRPIWSTKNTQGQPATLGKQAEEILNDNFTILESALGSTSEEVARKTDKTNIFNISQAYTKFNYLNKQEARNAIPAHLRGIGQIVSYKWLGGWVTEQYDGSDTSTTEWSNDRNWRSIQVGKFPFTTNENHSLALKFSGITTAWTYGALTDKGLINNDVNYQTTNFIEVEVGAMYSVPNARITIQYDENKQPIVETYSLFENIGVQFSIRDNAKYIRVTVHNDNVSTFKIIQGAVIESKYLNTGLPIEVEPLFESVRNNISGVVNTYDIPKNILVGLKKLAKGRKINIAGDVIATNENSVTTYFIEIKPDALYSINFHNEASALSAIMLYDENKVKILGTRRSVIDTNKSNQFITFTSPTNAKYIRISSDFDTWKYVYLCEGATSKMDNTRGMQTSYTPNHKAVQKIISQSISASKENILNVDMFKFAGVIAGQNITSNDSDWLSTDYIEIDPTKSNISHEFCRYVSFFDENKEYISKSTIDNVTRGFQTSCFFSGGLSFFGDEPFRIRPKYMRVTVHITELVLARLWYTSQATTLKSDGSGNPVYMTPDPNNPHFVDSLKNLLNNDTISYSVGTISDQGETVVTSTDWMSTNLIDVALLPTRHPYFKNVRIIAQYDVTMKFIAAGYKLVGDGTGTGQTDFDLLPETKWIRLSIRKNLLYNAFVSTEPLINKVSTLRQGGVETYFNPDPDKVRAIMDEYGVTPVDIREPKTGYSLFADTNAYRIWKPTGIPIRSLKGNFAVKYNTYSTVFYYSITGINGTYLPFNLNAATFPNLIAGSVIWSVNLLGFDSTSDDPEGPSLNLEKGVRVCVITDKGQIYHNNPKGASSPAYTKFDESVIWDIEGRRLPSKTVDNDIYQLNPCLPDEAYMLTPGINVDNGYGNGGFPLQKTMGGKKYNRFYFHSRHSSCIPFWYMGGIAQNHKLIVIGTYRANKADEPASRICLFASVDGGRQWHNIQEYANDDSTNYGMKFNARGNKLIPNGIVNNYSANSLDIQKITLNIPTATNKEPSTKFIFGSRMNVTSVTTPSNNIVLTTSTPHGLETGNRIVIRKSATWSTSSFNFFINETMSEVSGGNFKTWRVRAINDTQLELYEYIHGADSNIPCRHIHAINSSKNNFVVSCGEIYPQGWISMLMVHGSDSWYPIGSLYDLPFVRLTSAQTAIQRSLGTLVMDNLEQTVIYASDDAMIERDPLQTPEGNPTTESFNSTGIYRGKLSDVDDINKFEVIYPAKQVAYLFQEYAGMWLFCGQQGEFAISIDMGDTWDTYSVGALPIEHPGGRLADGTVCVHGWLFYKK